MYSGQFLEMYSQSVHAQNLADSERKRLTSEATGTPASDRASLTHRLRCRLARIALGRRPNPSSGLRAVSQSTGMR
jgi:hypothetical protein